MQLCLSLSILDGWLVGWFICVGCRVVCSGFRVLVCGAFLAFTCLEL